MSMLTVGKMNTDIIIISLYADIIHLSMSLWARGNIYFFKFIGLIFNFLYTHRVILTIDLIRFLGGLIGYHLFHCPSKQFLLYQSL